MGVAKLEEVAQPELELELEGQMGFVGVRLSLAPASEGPTQQEKEAEAPHRLAARVPVLAHTLLPTRPHTLA